MQRRWLLTMAMSILAGCAGLSEQHLKFQQTNFAYERALRWGEYDKAFFLHKNEKEPLSEKERKRLMHYRISGYNVLRSQPNSDESRINQLIQIRYYNEDNAIERNMTFTLDWELDKHSGNGHINSPFPTIK